MRIEKWVYGGSGIGWTEGRTHLVSHVLPGELVSVETKKAGKGVMFERVTKVLEPSKDRIAPRCPHFGVCGGCHYQHARYDTQLELKAEILIEQLQRMGKVEFEGEVELISGPDWGYRNRCQFQIADGKLGYFEEGGNTLSPISQCPIASPTIFDAVEKIRPILPRFVSRFELFTNERDVQLNILRREKPVAHRFFEQCAALVKGVDQPSLDYAVGADNFRVGHKSFFQVNRFLVEELSRALLEGVRAETAIDLYAGVGLFTLPLARMCKDVAAVEVGKSAVEDMQFNLERAGAKARCVCTRVEDWLTEVKKSPDLVIADPPRSGLGKAPVRELLRLKPREIRIVSCNPSTLARDLEALKTSYELTGLTLIDLFPQTYHLEAIAKLKLVR